MARLDAIKEAQKEAMEEGVDYGVIPGTEKPTLLKPGAEKLAALFMLDVQPSNEKRWGADGHLTVVSRVTIFHAPSGARLGAGEAVCSTREKKYAFRTANLKCPQCEAETVWRSKHPPRNEPDAEPGWFCSSKKGGCGANFAADDERITSQERGQIDNPDLADLWNTVVKMATKRALVAAVLIVTGASAVFTQDIEDGQASPDQAAPAKAQSRPKLDGARVQKIGAGIAALKLTYREIGVMLGAAGADGLTEESGEGVREALGALTPAQAAKVEAHLEKIAQDRDADQSQKGGKVDGSQASA